mmetsp:Transcript_39849/g.113061  ORF Transcript_39849/g.113061 Transcript_39849/m.113061 type:complete len:265 (-) Transcript_39849:199-993(-)
MAWRSAISNASHCFTDVNSLGWPPSAAAAFPSPACSTNASALSLCPGTLGLAVPPLDFAAPVSTRGHSRALRRDGLFFLRSASMSPSPLLVRAGPSSARSFEDPMFRMAGSPFLHLGPPPSPVASASLAASASNVLTIPVLLAGSSCSSSSSSSASPWPLSRDIFSSARMASFIEFWGPSPFLRYASSSHALGSWTAPPLVEGSEGKHMYPKSSASGPSEGSRDGRGLGLLGIVQLQRTSRCMGLSGAACSCGSWAGGGAIPSG